MSARPQGIAALDPSAGRRAQGANRGACRYTARRVERRIIVCDGLCSARLWSRIGAGEDEVLTWVPRDDESRSRPPGFHRYPAASAPTRSRSSAEAGRRLRGRQRGGRLRAGRRDGGGGARARRAGAVLSDSVTAAELPSHPCLRATGLRSLIRDDVDEEFEHLTNLRRVVEVRTLLGPREKVGILLQPDPDPDGIAGGYALRACSAARARPVR